jgi:hypothetical protein
MTTIVTVLLGAGVLFIASALECQSLVNTFQKIVSNQTIDWSGQSGCTSGGGSGSPGATPGSQPGVTMPNAAGQCQPGYVKGTDGKCYSTAGI